MNAEVAAGGPIIPESFLQGATKETAPAKIEELRAARVDGRVLDRDYAAMNEHLHRVAAGEQAEAPNLHPTLEQKFEEQHAEVMRAGRPEEYRFEVDPAKPFDEVDPDLDLGIREALSAAQVPARLGGTLASIINQEARAAVSLTPEERALRLNGCRADLRQKWGADYDRRSKAIDAFLHEAGNKNELVANICDRTPWLLANAYIAESLWSIVEYQQSRK